MKDKIDTIDKKGIAKEILQWLVDNVENYIDNKETIFPIYFPVNSDEIKQLPLTSSLGELYLEVLDNKKVKRKDIDSLDAVIKEIKDIMCQNKEMIEQLFKRMIWFYEMVGFHKLDGPVIQEMDGYATINQFMFDAVGMDICITKRFQKLTKDGRLIELDIAPEVIKKEHVSEGFAVEIEIKKWAKVASTSLL